MKGLPTTWLALLLVLGSAVPVRAGLNRWTADHPEDGLVFTIVFHPTDPDVVLAGGVDGVYRSTDAGRTWAKFGVGLASRVTNLEYDPSDSTIIYALCGYTLYHSTDSGASWRPYGLTGEAAGESVSKMTVSRYTSTVIWLCGAYRVFRLEPATGLCESQPLPAGGHYVAKWITHLTDPNVLYLLDRSENHVWRTRDRGLNWENVTFGKVITKVQTLVMDPEDPETLFLGGETPGTLSFTGQIIQGGVHRTNDGGDTWSRHNDGLPISTVPCLTIDPFDRNRLYAGTSGGGLAQSIDGGTTWAALDAGPRIRRISGVYVSLHDPRIVLAGTNDGVIRSADAGANWESAYAGLTGADISAMAADPAIPGRLYAGTAYGRVYRRDGDGPWERLNSGFSGETVSQLVVHPADPARLYAGIGSGWMYRSDDGGAEWLPAMGDFPEFYIYELCANPSDPDRLDACLSRGIARTDDGGRRWSFLRTSFKPRTMAVDPLNPSNLLAAAGGSVYRSTDGGANWTLMLSSILRYGNAYIAFHPLNPTVVYTCGFTFPQIEVYRSTDSGASFQLLGQVTGEDLALDFTFDAVVPEWIWGLSDDGLMWRSIDGGATWNPLVNPLVNPLNSNWVSCLVADPQLSGVVYAGYRDGLYRSTDAGATWEAIDAGLPTRTITEIAVDPSNSQVLYVGTTGGVYKSSDSGQSWQALSEGWDNGPVYSLLPDPTDPDRLMAGTSSCGFVRSEDGGATWSQRNTGISGKVFEIQYHPRHAGEIWIGYSSGIALSVDSGDHWDKPRVLTYYVVYQLLFGSDDRRLYFQSGDLFNAPTDGSEDPTMIQAGTGWAIEDAGSEKGLYAVTQQGCHFSASGNGDWVILNNGLSVKTSHHIVQDPANPDLLYLTNVEVYRTATAGMEWRPITSGWPHFAGGKVLVDPHDPNRLFAYGSQGIYTLTIGTWDFNGDGAVDAGDLLWLAGALAGQAGTPGEVYPVADLTIDGRVDVLDLTLLLNVVVGNTNW